MWYGAFETNVQPHIVTPLLLPSVTLMLQVLRRQHPLTRASTKLTIQSNPFLQTFPQRKHGKRFTAVHIYIFSLYDWIEYSMSEDCVYWFCTKFGQLILIKIIKIVATRCQILRPKCTKFDFGWGSAPDPARGVYSAPLDPLAGIRGLLLRGRGKDERERGGNGRGGGSTPKVLLKWRHWLMHCIKSSCSYIFLLAAISKSAVTTTGFTTENKHRIKRLWVRKKVQQSYAFWQEMKIW